MSNAITGRATKSRSTFRLEIAVAQNIRASADRIWGILTNAQDFPRWNSTVSSIEGVIALGEPLK